MKLHAATRQVRSDAWSSGFASVRRVVWDQDAVPRRHRQGRRFGRRTPRYVWSLTVKKRGQVIAHAVGVAKTMDGATDAARAYWDSL